MLKSLCPFDRMRIASVLFLVLMMSFGMTAELFAQDETATKEAKEKAKYEKNLKQMKADLAPLVKRFGVDPYEVGIGNVVKSGKSFTSLKLGFDYMKKIHKKYNNQYDVSGHMPDKVNNELASRKFNHYYEFELSQDHLNSKFYYLYRTDSYNYYKLAGIWVSGGKITSVIWY